MADSKVLQLGVAGFGKLGLLHAALANGLENSRLSAIVEPSTATRSIIETQFPGVAVYSDHRDLIRSQRLDGVFVTSPTHLHASIACDFIDAGVAVFLEKPLAARLDDAKEILRRIGSRPVPNMVGYMSRHVDTFKKGREVLLSGCLGRLQQFRATMYIGQLFRSGTGWRYQADKSGGGVLITQNSHLLDLLRWYLGDVDWVSFHTRRLYSTEVEDAAHGYIAFENGVTGWIDTSWSERHYRTLSMDIHLQGENGVLDVNDDRVRLHLEAPSKGHRSGWQEWQKPDLFQGVALDVGGPQFTRQAEEFLSLIRCGGTSGSSIESAFYVQAIVESAYRSASQNGVPVHVRQVL